VLQVVEQILDIFHIFQNFFDVQVVHLDENTQQFAEPVSYFEQPREDKNETADDEDDLCQSEYENNLREEAL